MIRKLIKLAVTLGKQRYIAGVILFLGIAEKVRIVSDMVEYAGHLFIG